MIETNSVKTASANGNKPGVFATENCTVVVAQIGGTATLPCVVRKFNNGVVSRLEIKSAERQKKYNYFKLKNTA